MEKKVNKYKIISIILLIAIIAIGIYVYAQKYLPQQGKSTQIKEYKIGLYKTMLCEYSCPLTEQLYNNKTQLLPTLDCVKNCTQDFQTKWKSFNVTKEELITDDLLPDIGVAINDCKKNSLNQTTLTIDNTQFFSCSALSLENLKQNYSYIR